MVNWKQYTSIIRSSFEVLKSNAKSESLMNIFKRPMTYNIVIEIQILS